MILRTIGRIEAVHIPIHVEFDDAEPYLLTFLFNAKPPLWRIGRSLLADGLMNLTGDADVQIRPAPDTDEVVIKLDTRSGRALIRLDWAAVATFVRMTYGVVPRGAEYAGIEWNAFPGLVAPDGA